MFDLVCEPLLEGISTSSYLETFARELDVDPLCNPFFYFVKKLPLKIQSRWYLFDESGLDGDDDDGDNASNTFHTETSPTCGVYIGYDTDLRVEEILTAISNLKQTITFLHIDCISLEDVDIKVPVFRMDPDARYVSIESPLPSNVQVDLGHQLSACDKLQYLHIPKMNHTAPLIVRNLGLKTNLTHLDIEYCHPSEDLCIILCQQLQFLHHLKHLNLSDNDIGSEGAECLAESITSWGPYPPLLELNLNRCNITDSGAEKLMAALKNCRHLIELSLVRNNIGCEGAECLAKSIKSWGSDHPLLELNLNRCNIIDSGAGQLMVALKNCRHLNKLDLSDNNIESEGADCLAESIRSWGQDTPLQQLWLLRCNIEGSGAEKLMEALKECRRLKDIDMTHNKIGSTGAKKLAESIKSWGPDPVLTHLHLEDCSIDASGCIPLIEALASCRKLSWLIISNNPIGGTFESLDPHLVYPRLCIVDTRDTSLTEGDIRSIAAIINNQGLPELDWVYLGYHKLTGERLSGLVDKLTDGRLLDDVVKVAEMLKNESDEMLEAWKTIVQGVKNVWLVEGTNVNIEVTEELVTQEEERRRACVVS